MNSKFKKIIVPTLLFILLTLLIISSVKLYCDQNESIISRKLEIKDELQKRITTLENLQIKTLEESNLGNILNNLDTKDQELEVEIKNIKEEENGFELSYTAKANIDLYLPDYNALNCENEIKQRLIVDKNLYFVFHSGNHLYCDPFTFYETTPPWPILFLKQGEKMNFNVLLSKNWFGNDFHEKNNENVEKVKLIFGYVPKENLEQSKRSIEKSSERQIKARKIEVDLHRYIILETNIQWNAKLGRKT